MEYISILKVTQQNTAIAMKSGDLPVLATPCMAALMENAAKMCVEPLLEAGYTTVGTYLNITHDTPTPVGETVRAAATLTKQDGRAFYFDVTAYCGDNIIGKGTHTRFSVNAEKFMSKLVNN